MTKKVDLDGFCGLLESLRDQGWFVDGTCLTDKNEFCPVWSVFYHRFYDEQYEDWPEDWAEAARRIGLSDRDAMRITRAADGSGRFSKAVRSRLMAAVGIEHKEPSREP